MGPAAFPAVVEAMRRRLDASGEAPLAVAFSGGSDSLALLTMTKAWADAVRRPLCALTVDHGLHPDSNSWTGAAGEAARRIGAPWRALRWTGPKPVNGLPAAARRARHALLAEATREAGACVLLLGHTADDMAESELIRAETPGHGRLAEWAPSPAWPEGRGVFLLRPLLSTRRADLRSWLAAQGATWLDDPANADLRFARSRARLALGGQVSPDVKVTGWASSGSARPILSCADRPWLEVATASRSPGALAFDTSALLAQIRPADLLARALACVSGRATPPRTAGVHRLLDRLAAGEPIKATLSGARLHGDGGRVRLTRELGRSPPPPLPLTLARVQVFDGRFELQAQAPGWCAVLLSGHASALPGPDCNALHHYACDTRPALPALLGPGGEVRLPQPFGGGPATARALVGPRLIAALGLMMCESGLDGPARPILARGAKPPLVLSSPPM